MHTTDQPPGDTDEQAIRIVTTTDPTGYAGIVVQHVDGLPAASFPPSQFDVKTPDFIGPSLGAPRLVFQFSDGGYAELRPLVLGPVWQTVTDPNWDDHFGVCGPFRYEVPWAVVQACHPASVVTAVYLTTDPYGIEYRIDNLEVAGKNFSRASDNSNSV